MQETLGCLEEFSILILQRVKLNSSSVEIMILMAVYDELFSAYVT